MEFCRNAIEELVIEEAKAQIKRLRPEVSKWVDLSEVVAFALNRLPPMYATTQGGWLQQRRRARKELGEQVTDAVKFALLSVRRDPLRQAEPLPIAQISNQARVLFRLQKILNQDVLKWRDVPGCVEDAIMKAMSVGAISSSHASIAQRKTLELKAYLKRAKTQDRFPLDGQSKANSVEEKFRTSVEANEFDSYMSGAGCIYSNVMEDLVAIATQCQMARLSPEMQKRIPREEVAAYALNRLPPMYATNERGWKELRQQAKSDYANNIMSAIQQAIAKIGQSPARRLLPIPFEKFNLEQAEALAKLRLILQRDDITWLNVADVVEEILQQKQKDFADRYQIVQPTPEVWGKAPLDDR